MGISYPVIFAKRKIMSQNQRIITVVFTGEILGIVNAIFLNLKMVLYLWLLFRYKFIMKLFVFFLHFELQKKHSS